MQFVQDVTAQLGRFLVMRRRGRLACAEKSNEIEAIPRLRALLNIEGAIVTIDAMGGQTDIAEKIVDKPKRRREGR